MNGFKKFHEEMRLHGMPMPEERVKIKIPGAKAILENCFKYFLSLENSKLIWQKEYEEVAAWMEDNKSRGLFLYGDCGRGKSMLSRYIIPAILLRYEQKVVSVYDVQDMNKKLDEVLKKHIISLDDIGTEDLMVNYGNKRLAFAEIIDAAEKYGKMVIVSTNLSGEQITERYGERVMERVVATTKRIKFSGQSLRK